MKTKRLLFLVMAICLASGVRAQFYDGPDDIYYYVEEFNEYEDYYWETNMFGQPVRPHYTGKIKTTMEIPDNVITLEGAILGECTNLTYAKIGNGVKSIGDWFFEGCQNLVSVDLGDNIEIIEKEAFLNCSNLSSINIPENVKSIGNSVFEGCKNLTSITLPHNLTEIGFYAFTFNNQGGQ